MKKYLKLTIVLCVLAICATLLVACGGKEEPTFKPSYEIDVKVDGEKLLCSQEVAFDNIFNGVEDIVFCLYANAFKEGSSDPAYSSPLARYGGIEVSELCLNGAQTNFILSENGQFMTVNIAGAQDKDNLKFSFEYTVDLAEGKLRLSKCGESYNLSEFYPQLAVFDGEKFRADPYCTVGDPVVSQVADFRVKFDLPEGLKAACPGEITEKATSGGRETFVATLENARDFAVALNPEYEVAKATCGDTAVEYYHLSDPDAGEKAELAANALKVFSENFGEYPYKKYVLAATPFEAGGMEYSGMVYISSEADVADTIIHETAHQWWYNLVGSDNVNTPWLDEGLAEFSVAYYKLLTGDEEGYKADIEKIKKSYGMYERLQKLRENGGMLSMNKSIYDYTEYQYGKLAYEKAALMFDNILSTVGKEDFSKSLKKYVADNSFAFATSDSLKKAFLETAGYDISGLIEGWVSHASAIILFD